MSDNSINGGGGRASPLKFILHLISPGGYCASFGDSRLPLSTLFFSSLIGERPTTYSLLSSYLKRKLIKDLISNCNSFRVYLNIFSIESEYIIFYRENGNSWRIIFNTAIGGAILHRGEKNGGHQDKGWVLRRRSPGTTFLRSVGGHNWVAMGYILFARPYSYSVVILQGAYAIFNAVTRSANCDYSFLSEAAPLTYLSITFKFFLPSCCDLMLCKSFCDSLIYIIFASVHQISSGLY